MLVLVGVCWTAVSLCVVVVVVGAGSFTTVVQEERAATAIIGTNKISFFIVGVMLTDLIRCRLRARMVKALFF